MTPGQEKPSRITLEIFPSLSAEKRAILRTALPSLFALLEDREFHQGQGKELEAIRHGLVFEAIAREEFWSRRSPLEALRRLEKLIISSMKSDIGFLRPRGESYHRPDILVMEYDEAKKLVTITQIGEIKLSLWGLPPSRLEKVLRQRSSFLGDLRDYLAEVAPFRDSSELKSLIGIPVQKIKLLTEEEKLQLFYILLCDADVPPLMSNWEIKHSSFSRREIKEITQTLLETASSMAR